MSDLQLQSIKCEHDLQKRVMENIIARGGVVIRVNAGGSIKKRGGWIKLAKGGTSDTIALYKGVFLAIELKYDDNTPSDKQIAFLESIAEAGGVGLVAYDSEFVEQVINNIDRHISGETYKDTWSITLDIKSNNRLIVAPFVKVA